MGKIINITEPDGTNIKYDYDYAGNLVSTTDGNGKHYPLYIQQLEPSVGDNKS